MSFSVLKTRLHTCEEQVNSCKGCHIWMAWLALTQLHYLGVHGIWRRQLWLGLGTRGGMEVCCPLFQSHPCRCTRECLCSWLRVMGPIQSSLVSGSSSISVCDSMAFITDCVPAKRNGGVWILRANMESGKVSWLAKIHRTGSDSPDETSGLHSHTPSPGVLFLTWADP